MLNERSKVLIIANARWQPGMSGSDIIYLNFKKYWNQFYKEEMMKGLYCRHKNAGYFIPSNFFDCVDTWEMLEIDFKPFAVCYIWRIILGCWRALICRERYDFVYSASDFWMDAIPAWIMKWKGNKWVAGFYLYAPRCKTIYYFLQRVVYWLIKKYADVVCVTNGSMVYGFKDKKTVEVNGGVDLSLCDWPHEREPKRTFDAVFCGRIHPSKGIDELMQIWKLVRKYKPDATLAIIGDYDLGVDYIRKQIPADDSLGITLYGYLNEERFRVYKISKVVLYPSTWDHFSMSPVEAMACGCPLIAFDLPVMKYIKPQGAYLVKDIEEFANLTSFVIRIYGMSNSLELKSKKISARVWARGWDWKIRCRDVWNEITNKL